MGKGLFRISQRRRRRENRFVNYPVKSMPLAMGDSGQYLYILCSQDQTVSVIDCSTNTVTATITLTASKAFSMLFYRALDRSIYVLGTSFFNQIDSNPLSGTFNTVISSGATTMTSPKALSYLPFPFDSLGCWNDGNVRFDMPFKDINNASVFLKWFSNNGRRSGDLRVGHGSLSNIHLHPNSRLLEISGGANDIVFSKIYERSKDVKVTSLFTIKREQSSPHDLFGKCVSSYVFKNCFCGNFNGTLLIVSKEYEHAPILLNPAGAPSGAILLFFEYAPNAKRLFCGGKSGTNLYVWDVAPGSVTGVGIIDRTTYKATNDDGTEDIIYNPYNGFIYVQGKAFGGNATGVNKIHYYNPTLALASMYQGSITVGEMGNVAARSGNSSLNAMSLNRTRYWEDYNVVI